MITDEITEQRIRDGDEEALDELITKLSPTVAGVLRYFSGGALLDEDIEEITADAFLTMWFQRESILPGHMEGYIIGIAKNIARVRMRYNKLRRTADSSEDVAEDDFEISRRIEDEEAARALQKALDELGEPDRSIILRHYYYYQPSDVIGEAMDMKPSTVRSRLKRARDKLRDILMKGGFLR